jgi:hypothetical protein
MIMHYSTNCGRERSFCISKRRNGQAAKAEESVKETATWLSGRKNLLMHALGGAIIDGGHNCFRR